MASSSYSNVCTLCQDDEVPNQAVIWCTECEVFLCIDCDKHHKKSPSSKYHNVMSSEDYRKLPKFMQEISSHCQEHNKKFELYCSFHACPCCVQCVTKHQKCGDIKPLSDILTNVKSSALVQLLEEDLKVLELNFNEILRYLKSMIDKNRIQKTKAIEKIYRIRKSLDDYFNSLEQQILHDLDSNQSRLNSSMNTLVKQIDHRSVVIHQLQEDFTKMTKYATKLQMYVGLREIEKTTSEAAKYIEDLRSGDHLKENYLDIKISSALQSILQDVKSFGKINITTSPSTVQIKAGRKDQAQDFLHTVPLIDQIKPSLLKKVTMPNEIGNAEIFVCRILSDGRFLFLDRKTYRLLLFNKEGIYTGIVMTFKGYPYDFCIVRNHTIAISFIRSRKLELVDIENNKINKTIEFSHNCHAVTSDGQILVVNDDTFGGRCTILNLNDMSQKVLKGVTGSCLSLSNDNIYSTNIIDHKVSCYKRTGEPLWTFVNKDVVSPFGLALDINGFVYVASSKTSKIVVMSPDGKTSKTILTEADDILIPIGIDINRDTGMMIASCKTRDDRPNIMVFKI